MIELKKRGTESNESLTRRFTRRVRQSGFLLEVKKMQFHEQNPTRRKRRASALRRNQLKSQSEYLRKIGKLEEIVPGLSTSFASKKKFRGSP